MSVVTPYVIFSTLAVMKEVKKHTKKLWYSSVLCDNNVQEFSRN